VETTISDAPPQGHEAGGRVMRHAADQAAVRAPHMRVRNPSKSSRRSFGPR
jgi:hypothetical protein